METKQMTDPREIRSLAARMEAKGATVTLTNDADGYLARVQIEGAKGIGPFPMPLISAAERMREWLSA